MEPGDLTHDPSTNNPPVEKPQPPAMPVAPDVALLEAAIKGGDLAKFLADAEAWITSVDRAPAEITDEKTAAGFAKTISELIKARKGAETHHAALKAPWYAATKAIDAIFLTGVVRRAEGAQAKMEAIQKRYIAKQTAIARAAQEETARKAQAEAEALRETEAAKLREAERAMDRGDLDASQALLAEASGAAEQAGQTDQAATAATAKAEGKASDLVRTHHAVGVTTSAKTFWNVEVLPIDKLTADQMLVFWKTMAPYIGADVRLKAAKAAVKAGLRECPGLRIFEDFNPINRG